MGDIADEHEQLYVEYLANMHACRDKVILAALKLFNGYTAEDPNPDWWKTDPVLDHRVYNLFLAVEALKEKTHG